MGKLGLILCTFCYLGLVNCTTTILPDVIEDVTSTPEDMMETSVLNEETETTELPTTTSSTLANVKVAFSNIGCMVKGQSYFEGQYLPNVGGVCSACYCLRGEAKCEEIKCKAIPPNCKAVKKSGICCAVDYECEGSEKATISEVADKLPKDRDILLGVKDSIFSILGIEPVETVEDIVKTDAIITNKVRTNRQNRIEEGVFGEKNTPTELPVIEEITEIVTESLVEPIKDITETVAEDKTIVTDSPPLDAASEKIVDMEVTEPKTEEKTAIVTTEKDTQPEVLVDVTNLPMEPKAEPEPNKKLDEVPLTEEPKSETPLPLTTKEEIVSEDNLGKVLDADLLPEYDENYDYEYILDENYDEAYLDYEDPILITNDKNSADIHTAKPLEEDFPTYDINVGTSIIAGDKEPTGVGQVIPVDLHIEKTSTTPPKIHSPEPPKDSPASSFLDSILNLFTGTPPPEEPEEENTDSVPEDSASFVLGPMRPPTRLRPVAGSKPVNKNRIDDSGAGLSPPPFPKSVESKPSRNDFPIRRPSVNGERRPGLLPRPNFPISKRPSVDETEESLPTKPIIEDKFEAVTASESAGGLPVEKQEDMKKKNIRPQPTLPPSLPNLQIIPFVASDALKKKENGASTDTDDTTMRAILPERIPHRPRHDIGGKRPSINNRHFPGRRPTLPHRKEHTPSRDIPKSVSKESQRHKNLRKPLIHRPKPIDKKDHKEASKSKTHSRSDLPPLFGRPFRNRTGTRPSFIPPRRHFRPESMINSKESKPSNSKPERTHGIPELRTRTERPTPKRPERPKPKPAIPVLPVDEPISEMAPHKPSPFKMKESVLKKQKEQIEKTPMPPMSEEVQTEKAISDFVFPFMEEKGDFLPPNLLLPKPIPKTQPEISDDIINFVLQDKLKIPTEHASANVLFDRQKPSLKSKLNEVTTTPLPEIPDSVKNQLPLGNDPILSAGLFELAGCNVYGRMYDIGNKIKELSAKCKECRCTPVGVQCLPMC